MCHNKNILIHTDATQFFGKLPIDLRKLKVDFLSFSGHNVYGPKGIGGLFVRDTSAIQPYSFGGGQEEGLRSGTLNVPGIIGLAEACKIYANDQASEYQKIKSLQEMLEAGFLASDDNIKVNSATCPRLPNISSITFPIREGYTLINDLAEENLIACSSGSVCDTVDNNPSHVMTAIGKTRHQAKNTLRFSMGRFTNEDEIHRTVEHVLAIIKK